MRFRVRHVQQSVADQVERGLIELGWINEPVNFDTEAVTFIDVQPEEAGVTLHAILIATPLGEDAETVAAELGAACWPPTGPS